VEAHQRLVFPVACLVFALLAVSLGARPRRGGRAVGLLIAISLLFGYYLVFIVGTGLARHGRLWPAVGVWSANALIGLLALVLLPRLEHTSEAGWLQRRADALIPRRRAAEVLPANTGDGRPGQQPPGLQRRLRRVGFPLLVDLHVLRSFLLYFFLLVVGFVLLSDAFTFFELLDDIARHHTPFLVVVDYFRYLLPYLLYLLAPLAGMVAALITLGVMTKNNEIVALKAAGMSLYRLAVPLLAAGLLLAAALVMLDETYLPYTNQRQEALRNEIRGRPAQSFYQPSHQWIFGEASKIYNYDLFDADHNLFGGLSVFELDPATFQLRRRVFATRAHWEQQQKRWILESGWVRDFDGARVRRYRRFAVETLDELNEPPQYFNREVRQSSQMSWRELRRYIAELQQAGFDVARLSVQWHKKLAYPLLALVSVLLAVPFAFLVGTRGAVGGLAQGVGLGVLYWMVGALFEAVGAVGQMPPLLAGWAPDVIFAFLGLCFFLKMPT